MAFVNSSASGYDVTSMEYESESFELENRSPEMRAAQLCGLVNMGNTCFANAFLQALFGTDKFTDALISQSQSPSSPLLARLQELFASMIFTDRYAFPPNAFLSTLPDWLRGGQQHDSSEFGRFLLDSVEEAIKADYKGQSPPVSVSSIFGGKTATVTKCSACGSASKREEDFVDIGLTFPPAKLEDPSVDLGELLKFFETPETLTGDNQYRCSACGDELRDAEKRMFVTKAPEHFVFSLNRFSFDLATQTRRKLLQEVVYPEWIDIHVEDSTSGLSNSVPYILYAVVMHSGQSAEYGHYYAYARHSSPASSLQNELAPWHRFNDENVAPSSFESFSKITRQFHNDVAYLLFYARVKDASQMSLRNESTVAASLLAHTRRDNEKFATSRASRSVGGKTTSRIQRYGPATTVDTNYDDSLDFDGPPPDLGGGLGMGFGGGGGIC